MGDPRQSGIIPCQRSRMHAPAAWDVLGARPPRATVMPEREQESAGIWCQLVEARRESEDRSLGGLGRSNEMVCSQIFCRFPSGRGGRRRGCKHMLRQHRSPLTSPLLAALLKTRSVLASYPCIRHLPGRLARVRRLSRYRQPTRLCACSRLTLYDLVEEYKTRTRHAPTLSWDHDSGCAELYSSNDCICAHPCLSRQFQHMMKKRRQERSTQNGLEHIACVRGLSWAVHDLSVVAIAPMRRLARATLQPPQDRSCAVCSYLKSSHFQSGFHMCAAQIRPNRPFAAKFDPSLEYVRQSWPLLARMRPTCAKSGRSQTNIRQDSVKLGRICLRHQAGTG